IVEVAVDEIEQEDARTAREAEVASRWAVRVRQRKVGRTGLDVLPNGDEGQSRAERSRSRVKHCRTQAYQRMWSSRGPT
ncbi:hypothetical protein B8W95_13580, partial [Staphylococcus pasteuri]